MSISPNPFGYQVQTTYAAGTPSQFDIAGIAAQIDRAASSLKPDERGALTVQLDRAGVGAGLVVRGPLNTSVLATVTKPYAGRWNWSTQARIAFLVGDGEPSQMAVRVAPQVRGLYRLFRKAGNGKIVAAVKAIQANGGAEIRLGR